MKDEDRELVLTTEVTDIQQCLRRSINQVLSTAVHKHTYIPDATAHDDKQEITACNGK